MQNDLNSSEWLLSNRKFKVSVNREVKQMKPLWNGLSQGSILFPILFNIPKNDLKKIYIYRRREFRSTGQVVWRIRKKFQ